MTGALTTSTTALPTDTRAVSAADKALPTSEMAVVTDECVPLVALYVLAAVLFFGSSELSSEACTAPLAILERKLILGLDGLRELPLYAWR
ncbi:hypothetical protein GCM10028811_24820 [Uliginosibacterium sediminicola]